MASTLDPEQRAALHCAKLTALVRRHVGAADLASVSPVAFAGGAGLVHDGVAWVLIESVGVGLGAAMAWAAQQSADGVQVVTSGDAAPRARTLARQATHFAAPPTVWVAPGPAIEPATPEPLAEPPPPPAAALAIAGQLRDAGLDVVVEHGIVCGEVFGLEVARVVVDDDGGAHIEAGVGPNDREAFTLLHGGLPTPAALQTVADKVRAERRPGRPSHPLNRIAAERWLRARVLDDPTRLPGWVLTPVPGPEPRRSLNDQVPAFAVGHDDAGARVVVAFSVGIDLDLVPQAADARAALDDAARLVLLMPSRDAHAVTVRLAGRLVRPADVMPVEGDWR